MCLQKLLLVSLAVTLTFSFPQSPRAAPFLPLAFHMA